MNRNYVIIDSSEVPSVDFNNVLETSANTLRYNVAGDKTFVKYEGAMPPFLLGKDTYSHAQILEVLAGEEWTQPMEL
jgi:hypothetical protein